MNLLIIIKLAFSQQQHVQIFPLPSPSKTCAFPFDFALDRDPKNIFYCQRDVENYTDQVFNFLLFDKHEYIHTESSGLRFWSAYLCYGFIEPALSSSIFDWQNRFIFRENSFSEELAFYWLLTFYVTSFSDVNKQPSPEWRCVNWTGEIMVESSRWVSNIKISIILKKGWFSKVRVSLKWEE